jgi:DNA invertase Pin-like site-specific DNA recombinase
VATLPSSVAKVEAQKISERTKAGMARAKAKGIKIGRPRLGIEARQKIALRAARGETPHAIAAAEGGSSDIRPVRSNSTHEKEHEKDDQNDANDTDAAVTVAIAVAAEPATEATNQEDDENDDKNQSQW